MADTGFAKCQSEKKQKLSASLSRNDKIQLLRIPPPKYAINVYCK